MEPVTEETQEQQETSPAFMNLASHIEIDSISIDLSSTDIDELHKGCDQFTIRGFVAEVRKKNGGLRFLFYSDRGDNSSDMPAYELPPMEVHNFRSSECNKSSENSNSSPGTSKDGLGKNTPPQNKENQKPRRFKGFEKLYIKAGWTDLIDGSWTSERKENQIFDGHSSPEMAEEVSRDPLSCRGNNQTILQKDAMVGSSNSRCAPSGKSVSEAVIVPFSGIDCAKATSSRKPDKDTHKHDGSSSQGMSKGVMVPPGGSSGKATTSKSFKEPKQRKAAPSQGIQEEFSMPPPGGFNSRKNSSKSLGKGDPTKNSTSLNKKRSYAKRSVRQGRDGFERNTNQDSPPRDSGAMEADAVAPNRVALQLKSNEDVVSCNVRLDKSSNLSTAGKPECGQSVNDNGKNVIVDEQDHTGVKPRREPKFRSLSDVMVAEKPSNVGMQTDNLKPLTGDLHDVDRVSEHSGKRKVSPVAPLDKSTGKDVSAKGTKTKPSPSVSCVLPGASASGIRRKRKRCTQDGEQHSPGGEGQVHIAEPCPSVSPVAMNHTADRGKEIDKADAEKKAKKAKSHQRPEPQSTCEQIDKFLKTAFGTGKAEKIQGNGNVSPQNEEGQTARKFLQGSVGYVQPVPRYDSSDRNVNGNGANKRNDVMESSRFPTTALPAGGEHYQNSISPGKESWKLQVEARGTMDKRRAGEGPSCIQKGKNDEAKGRMKDIDINSIPVEDKTPDQSSTDDIPMDIVELLAKNQHERRREANRDTLNLGGSTRDSNTQRHSGMLKPQASYGFSKHLEVMNPGKQKVSDNYEAGGTNVLVGYPNNGHFPGNYAGYTQSKGHVPSGAQYSSSVGTCLGTPYNSSSPAMVRQPPQPSFGRYQGNTQIWHPTMQSHGPLGMHSRRQDMYHKGSVPFMFNRASTANQSSIPPQTWNSRISECVNQSPTPPQNSERNSRIPGYANGMSGPNPADFITPKGIRPVDLASNETIPALQLLNFVQVASRSNTPPVNRNSELLNRLPFDPSGNQHRQYVPGPHFQPYKATPSSSRHPSHDTTSSAFQNELKTRWNFASQDQQNMAASSYNTPVGNLCFDKSTTRVYSNDKKRHFSSVAGPSCSGINVVQPMKKQTLGFASYRNEERAVVPFNDKAEVCSTNRNPAEILDARESRKFMIGPEDLISSFISRRRKTTPKADNRHLTGGPVIRS